MLFLFACLFLITHGFIRPLPAYSRCSARFNKEDEDLHFDDFDFVIGEQASAPTDPLLNRIREFKQDQVRKDTLLAKNWKTGNWKVRGFSLDKEDPDSTVHVSKLHESLTPNQVIVGRTDGTICFVRLGTEYLTQFVGKLTAQETGNATVSIQNQLVRNDEGMNGEILMDAEGNTVRPFSVERQFKAHDSSIVALEENDDFLFTASKGTGEIRVWELEEDKVIPHTTLTDAHSDTVVALTTVSYEDDNNLLFSASCDGSLALWDVNTGDMVYKCQMMQDEEASPIVCADVDQSRSIIYLGMATGDVVGYKVEAMIECASTGGECPVPSGRFMAHDGGVTAVKCAGEGTLARSNPGTSSSLLLTGGSDGTVKQWLVEKLVNITNAVETHD
jgi:WD40 repeat protein